MSSLPPPLPSPKKNLRMPSRSLDSGLCGSQQHVHALCSEPCCRHPGQCSSTVGVQMKQENDSGFSSGNQHAKADIRSTIVRTGSETFWMAVLCETLPTYKNERACVSVDPEEPPMDSHAAGFAFSSGGTSRNYPVHKNACSRTVNAMCVCVQREFQQCVRSFLMW